MKQRVVNNLSCDSTVEKVFTADGSLRGSRRFEKQDTGAALRLTSVEFDNRAIVPLWPSQQVQSVTVPFGPRLHNVALICNRQTSDNAWRIDELSNGAGSTHRAITVPLTRSALPAEIPTSTAEIQQVRRAALAQAVQGLSACRRHTAGRRRVSQQPKL